MALPGPPRENCRNPPALILFCSSGPGPRMVDLRAAVRLGRLAPPISITIVWGPALLFLAPSRLDRSRGGSLVRLQIKRCMM